MPMITLNDDWGGLLADPETDSIYVLPYRIVPGELKVVKNGYSPYALHEYMFQCLESDTMFTETAPPGFWDACSQEVVVVVYHINRLQRSFLKPKGESLYWTYAASVIGLQNGHVVTDPAYRFWNDHKQLVTEERKQLLAKFTLYCKEHRAKFAPYFSGSSTMVDDLL